MTRGTDFRPRRPIRWGTAALVAALHFLAIVALVHAFTPEFADTAVRTMTHAFDVPLSPPDRPKPEPKPAASPEQPQAQGAAGTAGKRAVPRDVSAPPAPVAIMPTQAPQVTGGGQDNAAGARDSGPGTGAGGAGMGLGAGAAGSGTGGGGLASKPVKIAGDINSARDYPRQSRDLRLGHDVTIVLRVGIDGRVKSCRIVQPSPDADADRITCRLATERFRFQPARDGAGNPVEADYGWRQRWFVRGQGEGAQ
ncbi:TonB family protein [Novosphingobium sp. BL-8A]